MAISADNNTLVEESSCRSDLNRWDPIKLRLLRGERFRNFIVREETETACVLDSR